MTVMYHCEYCGHCFRREKTLINHACEPRRRWLNKDHQNSILAFAAFDLFFQKMVPNQKRDFQTFTKSPYYSGFIRWADFVIANDVGMSKQYLNYLIENQIPLDKWDRDFNLEKFIRSHIMKESPESAVMRTIEYLGKWSEYNQKPLKDFFVEEQSNKIILQFKLGKLSPWFLFISDVASQWFDSLNEDQLMAIQKFIDPMIWKRKVAFYEKEAKDLKKILQECSL
jgi:hypothetical protein